MVNWSVHTKHILPFNCNNTTQDNTKVRKALIDENKGTSARRRVLMMVRARRRADAQARKARINDRQGALAQGFGRHVT